MNAAALARLLHRTWSTNAARTGKRNAAWSHLLSGLFLARSVTAQSCTGFDGKMKKMLWSMPPRWISTVFVKHLLDTLEHLSKEDKCKLF